MTSLTGTLRGDDVQGLLRVASDRGARDRRLRLRVQIRREREAHPEDHQDGSQGNLICLPYTLKETRVLRL